MSVLDVFRKKKKIGLALGGGAVLGAAHVGVIKAIEELDIEIDFVAGTSIGGLVASLFAFGKHYENVEQIALEMSWKQISAFSLSRFGILSNNKMESFLKNAIGEVQFNEASMPLAMVATNIETGEKVVLKEGNVAKAVMATTCIPGIFNPVEINGQMLVDGGIVENVPIDTLRNMGAEKIIAVDLNAKHTYEKPGNMIDILINSFHYTLAAASKVQTRHADILIEPDLSSFNRYDVDQVEELIETGYKETRNILTETSGN